MSKVNEIFGLNVFEAIGIVVAIRCLGGLDLSVVLHEVTNK